MKHVKLDTDGFPVAFYTREIHKDIPGDAIEITDDTWQDLLKNQGLRRFDQDAGTFVSCQLRETPEEKAERIRIERNALLATTDFLLMPDYPLADKSAWITYRKDLRDITKQKDFPDNVIWPIPPADIEQLAR